MLIHPLFGFLSVYEIFNWYHWNPYLLNTLKTNEISAENLKFTFVWIVEFSIDLFFLQTISDMPSTNSQKY